MSNETIETRMSVAEDWIRNHDLRCAERYGELRATVGWLVKGVFGMLLAIIAWLAIQLWNGSQAKIASIQQAQASATALTQAQARVGLPQGP